MVVQIYSRYFRFRGCRTSVEKFRSLSYSTIPSYPVLRNHAPRSPYSIPSVNFLYPLSQKWGTLSCSLYTFSIPKRTFATTDRDEDSSSENQRLNNKSTDEVDSDEDVKVDETTDGKDMVTVKNVSDYVEELTTKIVEIMNENDEFLSKRKFPLTKEEISDILFSVPDYHNIQDEHDGWDKDFPFGKRLAIVYQNVQLNLRSNDEVFRLTGIVKPEPLPSDLRKSLLTQMNNYVAKPTTLLDYHPGSDNKVQDIVHPSLYPYVHGLSVVEKDTDPEFIQHFDSPPASQGSYYTSDRWGRTITNSAMYQWLPSEFFVDSNGKVTIDSYINNLPTVETDLYRSIAQAFEHVLPSFEQSYTYSNEMQYYVEEDGYDDPGFSEMSIPRGIGSLRNRNLQVITKIVRIKLSSEEKEPTGKHILEGAWHAEGMSNENIVATASLTLAKDPFFLSTLYFKRGYLTDEAGTFQSTVPQNPPHFVLNFLRNEHVPLGKIVMKEDDITVFPNSHIHKIHMQSLNSYPGYEYRKRIRKDSVPEPLPPPFIERTILVFWLIDPDTEILSTKHVKEQQQYNPEFTLDKAYEHRLNLMKERSKVKQAYQQQELNLCEH